MNQERNAESGLPSAGKDAGLGGLDGGIRGTVADAVDFARECAEEWGVPVVVRVDERRADLPPIVERRADHDGPTWVIRPRETPVCSHCGGVGHTIGAHF